MTAPTCPYCNIVSVMTTGAKVYPHLRHLADKPIWECPNCDARVGCHPNTEKPLGELANGELRRARQILHNRMLDPLWKRAPEMACYAGYTDKKKILGAARGRTYAYLAHRMGVDRKKCHTGMFTLEQCRQAYRILKDVTPEYIRDWAKARKARAAKEAAE